MRRMEMNIRQGKRAGADTGKHREIPGREYVAFICRLYGDRYDDREEDSRIKGLDWEPGVKAGHKSMGAFQKELEEVHGIHLSRTKLQKILITGGCWSTERSREIQWLYEEYTSLKEKGGRGLSGDAAVREIARHLGISTVSVTINLPYGKVVYGLENKSANARRIDRWRAKKKGAARSVGGCLVDGV